MLIRWRNILAILVLSLSIALVSRADVVSDFDDGTVQGWTAWGDTPGMTNPGTGGNPGGFIRKDDSVTNTPCWMIAPSQYHGNWHSKSAISVDLNSLSGDIWWSNIIIEISGPGGDYTKNFGEKPPHFWKTYQAALTESEWTCVSGNWNALLDNVTDFVILLEYVKGAESNGMDNVRLIDSILETSIGLAKEQPDGRQVKLSGIVTRAMADCAYIQATDRSAGLRIDAVSGLVEGNLTTVTGTMTTIHGERTLTNVTLLSSTSGVMPKPLFVNLQELGGRGKTSIDPTLGTSISLKETGLLVRTFGYVNQINPNGTFVIKNGGLFTAKCAADIATPIQGSYVAMTGISSSLDGNPPTPAFLLAHDDCTFVKLPLGANLIRNGGAEEGPSGTAGEQILPIPGWNATAGFTTTNYGYIYPESESQAIGGGRSFFFCGVNTSSSQASQYIDVSSLADLIDSRKLTAKLSGCIGGRDVETDYGTVTALFINAAGDKSLGTIQIGPQAASNNKWVAWTKSAAVPVGTRRVKITIKGTRIIGKNCDAFFDNLSLILTGS